MSSNVAIITDFRYNWISMTLNIIWFHWLRYCEYNQNSDLMVFVTEFRYSFIYKWPMTLQHIMTLDIVINNDLGYCNIIFHELIQTTPYICSEECCFFPALNVINRTFTCSEECCYFPALNVINVHTFDQRSAATFQH